MFPQTRSNPDLPPNYLQFHEHAYVSPLNLINVTHPAPVSFGQVIPRMAPTASSIDTNKLQMYQFLAQRKLKEDRWKKQMDQKPPTVKRPLHQRNVRVTQQPNPSTRSASVPKKPVAIKRNPIHRPPAHSAHVSFTRPDDLSAALSTDKINEVSDVHKRLLVQLSILHRPPSRENIIDETEQEKQRRLRLKSERIKRDSRAIYNAHQELKRILDEVHPGDAHRHLNAYKAILLAVETLANEAPLKSNDAPIQQLWTAVRPVLATLVQANGCLGLAQLTIEPSLLQEPRSKQRAVSAQLLPSVYNELMKKKRQQVVDRRPRPTVLRPRSAESVRLPRSIMRPTSAVRSKARARSHSPLPSIRSASTIETPFHSRFTVDDILVKLAPRLLANYTGRELAEQIERARTLIPMFLVDNSLTDDAIVGRVLQMLMPRGDQQGQGSTKLPKDIFETPEERARRVDIDVYHTQISSWEDEMSQIRQRLQNSRINRLEDDTAIRRRVQFHVDPSPRPSIPPENVHIHTPLFEHAPIANERSMEQLAPQPSTRGKILRLQGLDAHKIRQIQQYRRDFQSHQMRADSAKTEDFDPSQVINRLSEFLLDEALLNVVQEVELLTMEISQKLVENELLGREISLADVEHRRPIQPMAKKHAPRSPSPPADQYNTSSFEEDLDSRHSDDDRKIAPRKGPMEGTGRFTAPAFEHRSSSSSSSPSRSPKGIILRPTIVPQRPGSIIEEINPLFDHDEDSSFSPKRQITQARRQSSSDQDDNDDELLLSTQTGEKIYSTDFDESRSKRRSIKQHDDDDDDDDEDVADTMKLSARALDDSDDD